MHNMFQFSDSYSKKSLKNKTNLRRLHLLTFCEDKWKKLWFNVVRFYNCIRVQRIIEIHNKLHYKMTSKIV